MKERQSQLWTCQNTSVTRHICVHLSIPYCFREYGKGVKMEEDSVTECDIKTEILPSPTSSVFVKEEDVKTEILELEGIFSRGFSSLR